MSRISFFVAAILSSICTSGRADIFFDDFEAEGVFTITQNNYNNFINWTVSDGTVDIEPKLLAPNSRRIGSGMDGFGNIVDLDGSSSNAGKLTSRALFNLQPGQYSLAFDMAGSWPTNPAASTTDSVNVSLGTLFSEVYVINSTNTVQTYVRTFDVSSLASAPIIFDHDGGDNFGILLDNIRLTAVPEPSSFGLICIVAAGLSICKFRNLRFPIRCKT